LILGRISSPGPFLFLFCFLLFFFCFSILVYLEFEKNAKLV
jgi:hypothetical protein